MKTNESIYRTPLALVAVVTVLVAMWLAKGSLDEAALRSAGWNPEVYAHPDAYFSRLAPKGSSSETVARSVPRPSRIDRFIVPQGARDSVLLERYRYTRGLGRADVHFYYQRGGSLVDLFAAELPGVSRARSVDSATADAWVQFPR